MTAGYDDIFVQRCSEIAAFVREHGHGRIPVRLAGRLYPLGRWCNQRRYEWRHSQLTPERIAQLTAAGLQMTEPNPRGTKISTKRARRRKMTHKGAVMDKRPTGAAQRPARRRHQHTVIRLSIQTDQVRLAQAARMVAESMRPPLIQFLLALPESVIRRLWREHHQRQAPGGQLPMYASNLLLRARYAAHGAVYASSYLQYAGPDGLNSMNPGALIAGLDLYRQVVHDPCITGTIAWYIVRDLRNRDALTYRLCSKCGAPYLTAPSGTHLRGCVFCQTMRGRRRTKLTIIHREADAI